MALELGKKRKKKSRNFHRGQMTLMSIIMSIDLVFNK